MELEAGAVILAGGFDLLDRKDTAHPHWFDSPHVLTNLALERYLSATGPTRGVLHPHGLNAPPRRIVFAQCVGSRDPVHGVPYCSGYCCAAALKQIQLTAALPHVEHITLCAMDVRAHGRDCEPFFRRVQAMDKVRLIHGRVADIVPLETHGGVEVLASHGGVPWRTEADLVVLAMGMRPSREALRIAKVLGLQTDPFGFVRIKEHHTVHTSRDGVYACGAFMGPKSIPSSVQEACAAAIAAAARLTVRPEKGLRDKPASPPPEAVPDEDTEDPDRIPTRAASDTPLRIGVFVCRCGTNIAGVIDTAELVRWVKSLPDVAYRDRKPFFLFHGRHRPHGPDHPRKAAEPGRRRRLFAPESSSRLSGRLGQGGARPRVCPHGQHSGAMFLGASGPA